MAILTETISSYDVAAARDAFVRTLTFLENALA
jgi:hypothetical protein